ncbi:MAG: carboxypeptidase-like regulatory domain-containing protein [Saprospiraceae bacterium]
MGKNLLFIILLVFSNSLKSQDSYNTPISGSYENVTLFELLTTLERDYNLTFYYNPDRIPYYLQSFEFEKKSLREVLNITLEGSNLSHSHYNEKVIIILPRRELTRENADELVRAWEAGEIELPTSTEPREVEFTFGESATSTSKNYSLRGRVYDKYSQQPVIGATLINESTRDGTATDAYGKYELSLPAGSHQIFIQYIGYQPVRATINIFQDDQLDIPLNVQSLELTEVVVEAKGAGEKVRSTQIGVEFLSPQKIRELPSFLGEPDVLKSIERLAGVSTTGDASAGFNVRGGNVDQNLVTFDGAPVFNASHILGFFSVFNPDMLSEVALYKGNMPAQYGGRASSALTVSTKDGDFQRFRGRGGLGLVNGKLMLEGPIFKNKTSFMAGVRSAYPNWILRQLKNEEVRRSAAFFVDGTAKITHKFNNSHQVSLTGYSSRDNFEFAGAYGFAWTTQLASLNWRSILTEQLSFAATAVTSTYGSELFEPSGFSAFTLTSGLNYQHFKPYVFYNPSAAHQITLGVEGTRYQTQPEILSPRGERSTVAERRVDKDEAEEYALYLNDDIKIAEGFSIALGIRYSGMRHRGPKTLYSYEEGQPINLTTQNDTLQITDNQPIQSYSGWEPRISAKVSLGEQSSIKMGYNRLRQYIHLISNTAVATPVDIWQVSNRYVPPQESDNYSIGYFQNLKKGLWVSSLEFFYKDSRNLVTYKDLAQLLLNDHIETELLPAIGRAYGAEFSIQKTEGRWSGSLSYTYSRSFLRTQGEFIEERINGNEWFPTNFDQPHQLDITLSRKLNPTNTLAVSWTYRTGRPTTIPVSDYDIQNVTVAHFSQRNQFRIPAYHRLDVSYTVDNTRARRRGFRGSLNLSFYNLYAQRNPFSIYFRKDVNNIQQAFRLSVLGATFPALTYNFVF